LYFELTGAINYSFSISESVSFHTEVYRTKIVCVICRLRLNPSHGDISDQGTEGKLMVLKERNEYIM